MTSRDPFCEFQTLPVLGNNFYVSQTPYNCTEGPLEEGETLILFPCLHTGSHHPSPLSWRLPYPEYSTLPRHKSRLGGEWG